MPKEGSLNRDLQYIFLWKSRQKIKKENNAAFAGYSIIIFNINSWRHLWLSIFNFVKIDPILVIDSNNILFSLK